VSRMRKIAIAGRFFKVIVRSPEGLRGTGRRRRWS